MTLTTPQQSPLSDEGGRTSALAKPGIDVAALNARFEAAPTEEILAWAFGMFAPALSVVSSFQNCVLIDLATRSDSCAEIIFLDTGSHFAETLTFVEQVRQLYDLNLRVVRPGADAEPWPCGSERCCELRKVAPLNGALKGTRRVVERPTTERYSESRFGVDRRLGFGQIVGQGQPSGLLDTRRHLPLRSRSPSPGPSIEGAGIPVHRVPANDPSGLSIRGSASWPLAGNG